MHTHTHALKVMSETIHRPKTSGPRVRVGGHSADRACWNPEERPETRAADYCTWDVTPAILHSVKRAVDALNSTAVLGLNFRDGTNPMAAAIGEAHAIGDGIAPDGHWNRLVTLNLSLSLTLTLHTSRLTQGRVRDWQRA